MTIALVVEDDPQMMEAITDTLFTLGHDHELATNLQDARELIQRRDFDYGLFDLQIPAKPDRVFAKTAVLLGLERQTRARQDRPDRTLDITRLSDLPAKREGRTAQATSLSEPKAAAKSALAEVRCANVAQRGHVPAVGQRRAWTLRDGSRKIA